MVYILYQHDDNMVSKWYYNITNMILKCYNHDTSMVINGVKTGLI